MAAGAFARRHWRLALDGAVAATLIGLCVFGLAAADMRTPFSTAYWSGMPLVFGLAAFGLTVVHGGVHLSTGAVALREALHWLGAFAAVRIVFYFIEKNQFTESNAGLACGLVISLSTFLAGVHIQWRLAPIGAALLAATALTAFVEQNLFLLAAILALGLAGAVAVGRRHHARSGEGAG